MSVGRAGQLPEADLESLWCAALQSAEQTVAPGAAASLGVPSCLRAPQRPISTYSHSHVSFKSKPLPGELCCVVVDELHMVADADRGIGLEMSLRWMNAVQLRWTAGGITPPASMLIPHSLLSFAGPASHAASSCSPPTPATSRSSACPPPVSAGAAGIGVVVVLLVLLVRVLGTARYCWRCWLRVLLVLL